MTKTSARTSTPRPRPELKSRSSRHLRLYRTQGQPGRGSGTMRPVHALPPPRRSQPIGLWCPTPFRSRDKPASRPSSGGSCAPPYHGELAGVMRRVSVVNDSSYPFWSWSGLDMLQPPRGGVVGVMLGVPGRSGWRPRACHQSSDAPSLPHPVPLLFRTPAPLQADL